MNEVNSHELQKQLFDTKDVILSLYKVVLVYIWEAFTLLDVKL